MTGRKRPRPTPQKPARTRPRPRVAVEAPKLTKAATPKRQTCDTSVSGMNSIDLVGTDYDPWEAGAPRTADFVACGSGKVTGYYLPTPRGRAAYKLGKGGVMTFAGFHSTFQAAYKAVA